MSTRVMGGKTEDKREGLRRREGRKDGRKETEKRERSRRGTKEGTRGKRKEGERRNLIICREKGMGEENAGEKERDGSG